MFWISAGINNDDLEYLECPDARFTLKCALRTARLTYVMLWFLELTMHA